MDSYEARAQLRLGDVVTYQAEGTAHQGVVCGVNSYTVEVRQQPGGPIERITFKDIVKVEQPTDGILERGILLWIPRHGA